MELFHQKVTIARAGKTINKLRFFINASNFTEVHDACAKQVIKHQLFLLATPILLEPQIIYNEIFDMLNSNISAMKQPLLGLAMRLVKASIVTGRAEILDFDGLLERLASTVSSEFSIPLLYLKTSLHQPCNVDLTKYKSGRMNCMLYYYMGVNKLLTEQYEDAYQLLLKAMYCHDLCPEMGKSLVDYVSVAAFLSHVPRPVLDIVESFGFGLFGVNSKIWDHHHQANLIGTRLFYLRGAIANERKRRLLLSYSKTVSRIPLDNLKAMVGCEDFDRLLESLKQSGDIVYTLEEGIVAFKPTYLSETINAKTQQLLDLSFNSMENS